MKFTDQYTLIKNNYHIEAAYSVKPGAFVTGEGIVFSVVLVPGMHGSVPEKCGIRLFDMQIHTRTDILFRDGDRIGSLYSIMVAGLCPDHLSYCYFIGDNFLNDPYAHRLVSLYPGTDDDIRVSALSELDDRVRVSPLHGKYHWSDRMFYLLNVRAFTKEKASGVKARGTFEGVTEKTDYLLGLGVTTVELMPVTELCPSKEARGRYLTSSYSIIVPKVHKSRIGQTGKTEQTDSGKHIALRVEHNIPDEVRPNLWGFVEGYYNAPRAAFAKGEEHPEKELLEMVKAFHRAGIEVVIQLFFPDAVPDGVIVDTAHYWATRYGIDGLHLMGSHIPLSQLAKDPLLSETMLFSYNFPYEQLKQDPRDEHILSVAMPMNGSNPSSQNSESLLADYNDNFMYLLRSFVKGDDMVLSDFIRAFLHVPSGHGNLHYAANYYGFTLNDLVSYSRKHNEDNGEENRDGNDNNMSWNCGVEGRSRKKSTLELRQRQMRNFITLVMLSQGTPLIHAGDESENSQNGNNNPYCQDNEIGWTSWKKTESSQSLTDFTGKISSFRKEHSVFRKSEPFHFGDYLNIGYPDISYHGRDAWKPDFSGYSHMIGILYCEDYEPAFRSGQRVVSAGTDDNNNAAKQSDHLLYLAINMYWQNSDFGLPHLKGDQSWYVIMNTSLDSPFPEKPCEISGSLCHVPSRSIMILQSGKMSSAEKSRLASLPKSDLNTQAATERASGPLKFIHVDTKKNKQDKCFDRTK
ncbi:MAG: hypothetical protein GX685_03355 [Clostridiales bacterium]|nr:hypothetical protein [Clostridiales bacterium]